jgi:hypothetical protein
MKTRLDYCNNCVYNVNNVCSKCKTIHPTKDCFIDIGVTMVDSHCPLGLWQQQWSIVITNPTRQVVRAAFNLSTPIIIGTIPNWYIGKTLPSPPRYHSRYSDQLRWLQKAIDEPTVTENFLWVEEELPSLTFQEFRIPRYNTSPINPHDETILLERGLPTTNYETPHPLVFNKGRLQEVLDSFRNPFYAGNIYYNYYSTEHKQYTPPPREVLPYCSLEAF